MLCSYWFSRRTHLLQMCISLSHKILSDWTFSGTRRVLESWILIWVNCKMKFDELDFFVVEILNISFKTNCTHAFLFWKSLDMVTSFEVFLCDNIVNTFVVSFLTTASALMSMLTFVCTFLIWKHVCLNLILPGWARLKWKMLLSSWELCTGCSVLREFGLPLLPVSVSSHSDWVKSILLLPGIKPVTFQSRARSLPTEQLS